jgi:protein-disulfide isomerase
MVARCAGPTKYFAVVDQVFRSQPRWTQGNIKPIFQEIAAANGVDEAHFNACLQDQAAFDAINARAARASDQDDVHSTPTVFINGKKLDAIPQTPAEMDAAIAAALKGGG